MNKPRDGQEYKMDCELVMVYVEGDRSVGLASGWIITGLKIGRQFLEIDDNQFDSSSQRKLRDIADGVVVEENY